MNVVFWCFIFLLTANDQVFGATETSNAIAPRCLREDSTKCVIAVLSLSDPSHEIILPAMSKKSTLQIKRGNLTSFSEQLSNQLGTVEKLQLGPLELKKLFLNPELTELTAGGNQIDTVEFPSASTSFKLQVLDLNRNRLKHLNGFEVLVNLRELHLEGNALESVDLLVFKNMKLLEKMFLDRNQITTVTATEPVELPVLEHFSLAGNQIETFDVTNWQLDSLTKWDVSGNKLTKIQGKLDERFPSLQLISVARNEWHCKWLETTLQQFNESYVMIQDGDKDCQGISPANICCVPEHSIDPANDERLNEMRELESAQKDFRANIEGQFAKMKVDNESKLKALDSRLKKLEEMEKQKKDTATVGNSNPMKDKFDSMEQILQSVESSLEQEKQQWAKQRKDNDNAQRKLGYTILELKRSLERDTKQIAELQAQFEGLRDFVRKTLENRDTLRV